MKKYTITAKPREIIGRKVKQLRRQGQIPATVYGKNVKSASVGVEAAAFEKIHKQAGETGLIELTLGKDVRPVLINTVQRHPVTGQILHIEFRQVDLKEKVKANVPLELVGESKAVVDKLGVLLTILDEVEVEALPTDLPEKIELDVSGLAHVGEELKVKDLRSPSGVTIQTDAELTIVKVGSLVSREAEEQAAEEAAKAAQAQAAEAGAAEEAPKEAVPEEKAKEEPVSQETPKVEKAQ